MIDSDDDVMPQKRMKRAPILDANESDYGKSKSKQKSKKTRLTSNRANAQSQQHLESDAEGVGSSNVTRPNSRYSEEDATQSEGDEDDESGGGAKESRGSSQVSLSGVGVR